MTLPELELDTRLSYRIGSRTLSILPLDTIKARSFPEWSSIRKTLNAILSEEGVHVTHIDVVRRVQQNEDPKRVSKTLFVLSDISLPGQYEKWKAATRRINMLLLSVNRPDIIIEIIDSQAAYSFELEAIEFNVDTIAQLWSEDRNFILNEIRNQDWLSIDILNRTLGTIQPMYRPTICITAADADAPIWWNSIVPHIKTKLPPEIDVDVFLSSSLSFATGTDANPDDRPDVYASLNLYDDIISMGSSIGVSSLGTASIGTSVILRDTTNDTDVRCALTNHHVIARNPHVEDATPVGTYISPDHTLIRRGLVPANSPSDEDHETSIRLATLDLKTLTKNLEYFNNDEVRQQHTAQLAEKRTARLAERVEVAESDLQTLISRGDEQRMLGALFASSGYRIVKNTAFTEKQAAERSRVTKPDGDATPPHNQEGVTSLHENIGGNVLGWGVNWALIRIQPKTLVIPGTPWKEAGVRIRGATKVDKYQTIRPGRAYEVTKFGRTTRWTTGRTNCVGSLLNLRPSHDRISVVPTSLDHRYGSIGLACGIMTYSKSREFLAPGDFGSVVLLNEPDNPAIVGLGYAANQVTMVSYMTPFDLVVKDIEKVTGCRVVKPTFAGVNSGDEP